MKNKLRYIFTLALALILNSCGKEFLEITPQDTLTADNFFKNEGEIRSATASLYGFPWFDFNDKFFWSAGDAMPGNLYSTYDQEGQFFYFSFNEGNAHINAGWRSLYRVISYSNSIINDMPVQAEKNGVSKAVIAKAIAEARFIRGTAYYILAEFWGDVPLIENNTLMVTTNNMRVPKNTRTSVYEFARRDFEFASESLPATDLAGRVTKWSAKGMLAKLHLTMAQALSDANSSQNFEKAKELAADVINNSGLSLEPKYEDLFKINESNSSTESLFALQWIGGTYGTGNSRQANMARNSIVTGNTEAWGGGKSVSFDFVSNVEPGDARKQWIFMSLGDHYPEINKQAGGYTYNIVTKDPEKPAQNLEDPAPVLNNVKKYIAGRSTDNPPGTVTTQQATAVNTHILRLADVYLIYAEAAAGAGGATSDATALAYFNAVRTRANLSSLSTITFADILKERRVEFGMESLFWFDVKRFYYRDGAAALEYLNNQKRGHTYKRVEGDNPPDANTVEGYTLTPPETAVVVYDANMVLPIPSSEVIANPLLSKDQQAVEYTFK